MTRESRKRLNVPAYDLNLAQHLVLEGRCFQTKKSTAWLRHHGYDADKALRMVVSLSAEEFEESLPPERDGGQWADVYRCSYEDEELEGIFYVKFAIENDSLVLVLLSCKEWGYGW